MTSTFFDRELDLRRDIDRLEQELEGLRGERERLLHELRKPLANIAAVLETNLSATVVTPALVHALLVEARRMASMLDTAGASTRELRTRETTRIDLDLEDCKILLTEVTAQRGIDLAWQIDSMPPLPFDAQVLRSLLCNLVTNAMQACTDHDCIEVCATLENGVFMLGVLDSGTGMPPETLARCTELGSGLASCRELVQAADGWLEIASRPGSGTRVQICLPLTESFKFGRPE